MPLRQYSVVIADDHQIIRDGVKDVLARAEETHGLAFDVCAEAVNGLEALGAVKAHEPDLLFLDIAMPLATGTEILADVRRWSPETRVVIYTGVLAPGTLASVVEADAHAVLSKTAPTEELPDHLAIVLSGGRYIAPELVDVIERGQQAVNLTGRERQTLNMIIGGKSNKEIARVLNISPKTVDKHRTSLMRKLDVHSIAELMARALQDGLIGSD